MSAFVSPRASLGAAFVLICGLGALPTAAAAAGPFKPFLGNWSGSGSITSNDGRREPITCRATYANADSEQSLSNTMVCASDSFRVNIEMSVTADGGALRGQWQETTRGAQGEITGQIGDGDFEGQVSGMGFTAVVSLRSNGKRQAVQIQPSAGDIKSVDISLSKRK